MRQWAWWLRQVWRLPMPCEVGQWWRPWLPRWQLRACWPRSQAARYEWWLRCYGVRLARAQPIRRHGGLTTVQISPLVDGQSPRPMHAPFAPFAVAFSSSSCFKRAISSCCSSTRCPRTCRGEQVGTKGDLQRIVRTHRLQCGHARLQQVTRAVIAAALELRLRMMLGVRASCIATVHGCKGASGALDRGMQLRPVEGAAVRACSSGRLRCAAACAWRAAVAGACSAVVVASWPQRQARSCWLAALT